MISMPSRLDDDHAWSAFARSLTSDQAASLIHTAIRHQMRRMADHLAGYMNRYWLVAPDEVDASGNSIRVHNILRADTERHLHDHPWNFRSVILGGSYIEELLMPSGRVQRQRVSAGDTYMRVAGQYHRIAEISTEPVWTLCVLGQKHPTGWGFLVDGTHIDSHRYLNY